MRKWTPQQAHYQTKRDGSLLAMGNTADWFYQMTLCYPQHIPYQSKTCLINPENTSVGATVLLQGAEVGCFYVPLHRIYLKSDLVTGPVIVGVRHNLPSLQCAVHLEASISLPGCQL
jgi:hypothetical protein